MATGATVIFDTLADVSQTIKYNFQGSDSNGNAGYYFTAIVTNIKAQASATGDIRDVQTITLVGSFQATPFTPQQIYTTVNGSTPGPLLATELKNNYNEAVATVVA